MNTNDHRDKEEGREDTKIRVTPEIARGCCEHGGPRKAEPGPACLRVCVYLWMHLFVCVSCWSTFIYIYALLCDACLNVQVSLCVHVLLCISGK